MCVVKKFISMVICKIETHLYPSDNIVDAIEHSISSGLSQVEHNHEFAANDVISHFL